MLHFNICMTGTSLERSVREGKLNKEEFTLGWTEKGFTDDSDLCAEISSLCYIAREIAESDALSANENCFFSAFERAKSGVAENASEEKKIAAMISSYADELAGVVQKEDQARVLPEALLYFNSWFRESYKVESGDFYDAFNSSDKEYPGFRSLTLFVNLISTDTSAGYTAASKISEILNGNFAHVEVGGQPYRVYFECGTGARKIKGLTVERADMFYQEGMSNLIQYISDIKNQSQKNAAHKGIKLPKAKARDIVERHKLTINITGGFKGVTPFLTLAGQMMNIELKYIFEWTTTLLTIPVLSIGFDITDMDRYGYYLTHVRDAPATIKKEMEERHIINANDELTPFGKLMKADRDNAFVRDSTMGHMCELKLLKELSNWQVCAYLYGAGSFHLKSHKGDIQFFMYKKSVGNGVVYKRVELKKEDAVADGLLENCVEQGDIDILVEGRVDNRNVRFAGECKMAGAVLWGQDDIPQQIVKNIRYLISNGGLDQFHLYFFAHSLNDKQLEHAYYHVIKPRTQTLLTDAHINLPDGIRAFVISLTDKELSMNYDNFISQPWNPRECRRRIRKL